MPQQGSPWGGGGLESGGSRSRPPAPGSADGRGSRYAPPGGGWPDGRGGWRMMTNEPVLEPAGGG